MIFRADKEEIYGKKSADNLLKGVKTFVDDEGLNQCKICSKARTLQRDASEFIPRWNGWGLVRERTDGRKHPYYLGPDSLVLKKSKYIG